MVFSSTMLYQTGFCMITGTSLLLLNEAWFLAKVHFWIDIRVFINSSKKKVGYIVIMFLCFEVFEIGLFLVLSYQCNILKRDFLLFKNPLKVRNRIFYCIMHLYSFIRNVIFSDIILNALLITLLTSISLLRFLDDITL